MSLGRHFRVGRRGSMLVRAVLASIALLAVLTARNTPSQFQDGAETHSRISADFHQDQRPRFDNSVLPWSAPVANVVLVSPTVKFVEVTVDPKVLRTLQATGFHFSRPPPLS
jgi:hypothetical protein